MKTLITIMLTLSSLNVFANEASEIKNLMNAYLKGMNHQSESQIKAISSDKYFKLLNKNNRLQKVFKMNKIPPKETFEFDMVYKKAAVTKNLFLVNIKDPKQKDYGEYWYYVKFEKGKYYIDDMKFMD